MIINKYKIIYPQIGAGGVPVRVTTGSDSFYITSYSEMINIYNILNKEEYKYMDKIKTMFHKLATELDTDYNSRPIISVTKKEFDVIMFIRRKILKTALF